MVCRLPEGRMGWHEIGGRCQVPKYFKRDWTTETTCFRTLFRTVTFHRHLFYILYIVFHQIYSNCIITKCKSWQWIAWKYALFLEKICIWKGVYVFELYGSVQRCKSHLPSCDAPPRGCDGIYIRALPCQPLFTGNGISSSLRLVERSFFVTFSWLLFWYWVACHSLAVFIALFTGSRRFHFIQSLTSPGYSFRLSMSKQEWQVIFVRSLPCQTLSTHIY